MENYEFTILEELFGLADHVCINDEPKMVDTHLVALVRLDPEKRILTVSSGGNHTAIDCRQKKLKVIDFYNTQRGITPELIVQPEPLVQLCFLIYKFLTEPSPTEQQTMDLVTAMNLTWAKDGGVAFKDFHSQADSRKLDQAVQQLHVYITRQFAQYTVAPTAALSPASFMALASMLIVYAKALRTTFNRFGMDYSFIPKELQDIDEMTLNELIESTTRHPTIVQRLQQFRDALFGVVNEIETMFSTEVKTSHLNLNKYRNLLQEVLDSFDVFEGPDAENKLIRLHQEHISMVLVMLMGFVWRSFVELQNIATNTPLKDVNSTLLLLRVGINNAKTLCEALDNVQDHLTTK